MLKNMLSHWHYGIKARVVDGALLVRFDTAVEPALLRLDLDRVQANTLSVRAVDGDYELGLGGYKMDFVPLARFEAREAAETAQRCVECALFCGTRVKRFRGALAATVGVGIGLALTLILIITLLGGVFGGQAAQLMSSAPTMSTPVAGMGMGGMPLGTGPAGMSPEMLQAMQAMQSAAVGGVPQAPAAAPTAKKESGVPMSADDFLATTGAGQ